MIKECNALRSTKFKNGSIYITPMGNYLQASIQTLKCLLPPID